MATRNIETIYPLSPMQQGMLLHSLFVPNSDISFQQLSCTLRGEIDIAALRRAWERVVERHDVLRTLFVWEQTDKPLQVVRKRVKLPWQEFDWRVLPLEEKQERFEAFLKEDRASGFDLGKAPLMRVAFIRWADDEYRLIWSRHHILLDGWSASIVQKEVFGLYDAMSRSGNLRLPTPRPYKDYITWLQKQDISKAEQYWRESLSGFTSATRLIIERRSKKNGDHEAAYAEISVFLPVETSIALVELGRQNHLTMNTLVQGAWALLLSRYSGQGDVVFGATVSGRPAELGGVESMTGLFINTLPVRAGVPEETRLLEWLEGLQRQITEMRQYEYCPIVQIQRWSDVPAASPLFETALVFQNFPKEGLAREQPPSFDGPQVEGFRGFERTNYGLTVMAGHGTTLWLKILYDSRRFSHSSIKRLASDLEDLFSSIAFEPTLSLSEYLQKIASPFEEEERGAAPAEPDSDREASLTRPDEERVFVAPRNMLELSLTRIWEEILGIRPIGVKDNFFELRGQSLLAVSLMARIHEELGKKLSLGTLLQAPTIELLAEVLEGEGEAESWSPLVALQPHGLKRPFFCVHAVSGAVFPYTNLARHLGGERPFYGIQALNLDPQAPLYKDIEEMASAYVTVIRLAQPEGPYMVGGWSMGAMVAYEIAQQFRQAREQIALLALLDVWRPGFYEEPEEDEQALVETFNHHLAVALGLIGVADPRADSIDPAHRDRLFKIYSNNLSAIRRYVPVPYGGRITLLRPKRPEDEGRDQTMGWSELASGGVDLFYVPGNHYTLVDEPHVQTLAAVLATCIEKAEQ